MQCRRWQEESRAEEKRAEEGKGEESRAEQTMRTVALLGDKVFTHYGCSI